MKKLIFILLASLTFLLSCDPHNTENSINIRLDKDTVNKILSTTSARFADPKQGYGFCLYAVLKGNNGSRYEKSIYYTEESPIQITNNGDTLTFNLSNVSYRENYDLYIYIVQNGTSTFSGLSSNIELNKYGPTYVTVDLKIPDYTIYAPSFRVEPKDSNTSGNYLLTASAIDESTDMEIKTEIGSFGTNAPVVFTFEASNSDDISYDFYIIHNGKQTNLPMTSFFNGTRSYEYTITTTGTYTAALRKTDLTNNVFATYYMTLSFKENSINTNYVFYDNKNNKTELWYNDTLNDSNLGTTDYESTVTYNPFDFCFDSNANLYITNGTSIWQNSSNNSPIISSGSGMTIHRICYNSKRDTLIAYAEVTNTGAKKIGIPYFDGSQTKFNWVDMPDFGYNDTFLNIASDSNYIYLIIEKTISDNNYVTSTKSLVIYVHEIIEDKPSTGIMTINYNYDKAYYFSSLNYPYDLGGTPIPSYNVSDTFAFQGNLYFTGSVFNEGEGYNQRFGFLGKIILSTNQIYVTGLKSGFTQKTLNDSNYNNTTYFDMGDGLGCYIKGQETINEFIVPQRFIAIKPKELVISDDGVFIWNGNGSVFFNGYEYNNGWYHYKNVDRAVSVNLDSFSINSVQVLNNITWASNQTDDHGMAGCGIYIYTPN